MSSFNRAALSVALAIAPMISTGCVSMSVSSKRTHSSPVCDNTMEAARQAENSGNLVQAKRLYEIVHQRNPRDVESLHRLGVVCTHLKQHSQADQYYRDAYRIAPNNPELLADMGFSAFMRNDYVQSEAFLEQSVRLNDKDPRTINNLAVARAWRGKDESALATFRTVNGEEESRQRLTEIQIARDGTAPQVPRIDPVRDFAPPLPQNPDSIVQTNANDFSSVPIDLPAPAPVDVPETPQFDINIPLLLPSLLEEPVDLSLILRSAAGAFEVPIELPPPLPPVVSIPSVEQIELPSNPLRLVEVESIITREFENGLPPVPPADFTFAVNEQENAERQPGLLEEPVETQPRPLADEIPKKEIQAESAANPITTWRKTRQPRSASPVSELKERSRPLVQQASAAGDQQETKKVSRGICLVTLLEDQMLVPGTTSFEAEYQSQRYQFSSKAALEKFRADPRKYVPAAGGLDLVAVTNDRIAEVGTFNFALRFQRQLYLFTSRENAEEFRRNPQKYVSTEK